MRFEKWQALGNDYLILERDQLPFELTPARIRRLCAGHFGVFADGVLVLAPPADPADVADLRIFNPDGSEAELSGNGARDAAVLSPRLLDAAAYPTLSFTSTQLVDEQGQWSLRGELEVRGVTRLVEARITALRAEAATIRASARAGIDRYDFGITTYRGLAARRLIIDLDIIAHMEQS